MKQLYKPVLALAAVAVAFALGMSCTGSDKPDAPKPGNVTSLPQAEDAIDEQLMIALGQAKNFHYKAKVYMSDGKVTEAIASVRQILSLRFPANAPEADDVRNDARALLAKLYISQGQLDEAARVIDEGLAQSQRDSFFVANLYTVQGEIHQARAAALDGDESNRASASEERRAAITSYDKSIQINERLQKKLLEDR